MIAVNNLRVRLAGGKPLVHAVNFEIDSGATFALVGESGAGKTLTALAIAGLLPHGIEADGQVLMVLNPEGGEPTDVLKEKTINIRGRHIAMVFQDPNSSLNPTMTCCDQIAEAFIQHFPEKKSQKHEEVNRLLGLCGLTDYERIAQSYPHQLSGGQKQRVLLCIALACHPRLLIADEPTSALDAARYIEILDLLQDIKSKENLGLLLISHQLDLVERYSDTLAIMHAGEIVEMGKTATIFVEAQHPYTQKLLGLYQSSPKKKTSDKPAHPKPLWVAMRDIRLEYDKPRRSFFAKKESHRVLDSFHLDIHEGEILGLVGASGSGKSTIAKMLAGLLAPTQGTIQWHLPEGEKPRVSLVFQDSFNSLNPKIRIGSMLVEAIRARQPEWSAAAALEEAKRRLHSVSLPEESLTRYPHEFSGGQQQRISIARALVAQPHLLICDEMVSSLDISVADTIIRLLLDLCAQSGQTVMFISHDMGLVRRVCDRVVEVP